MYRDLILVRLEGCKQEVEVTLSERTAAFFGWGLWFGSHFVYLSCLVTGVEYLRSGCYWNRGGKCGE